MRDCNNTMGGHEGRLHDVHVLSPDGIVQPEEILVVARNFHGMQFSHGTSALMGNVVDDKDAPCVCELVVLPVMHLRSSKSGLNDSVLARAERLSVQQQTLRMREGMHHDC